MDLDQAEQRSPGTNKYNLRTNNNGARIIATAVAFN
jgi:hypothetical protein